MFKYGLSACRSHISFMRNYIFIMCRYLIKDNSEDLLETKTEITMYNIIIYSFIYTEKKKVRGINITTVIIITAQRIFRSYIRF